MQYELFDTDTIQRYKDNKIIFDFDKDLINLGKYFSSQTGLELLLSITN